MDSHCTFQETGINYCQQPWASCSDCFSDENEGACLYCLNNCHRGHKIGPPSKKQITFVFLEGGSQQDWESTSYR